MGIEIFHQLGYRNQWNFQSLREDHVGSGMIIAPSHMERSEVESLSDEIKKISFFDPQFFLPDVRKRKLATYEFFPDIVANGFKTTEYSSGYSAECAIQCVTFQKDNNFRMIVIPTRYVSGMSSNYIHQQQQLFIAPFLNAINKLGKNKPVLLQLVINDDMVKDPEYAVDLLNWITGNTNIDGVYLIADINPRSKQLKDIDFLYAYLRFIRSLVENGLYVLLGYVNTEALLLTLATPNAVTIGSYENLRMFNIRNFEVGEGKTIHGPNARLYVSKLMQWIDTNYLGAIIRKLGNTELFDDNHYKALMFSPTFRWHFSKPELYKHYLLVFSQQLQTLTSFEGADRYRVLSELMDNAKSHFTQLRELGVILDQDSEGSHLNTWLTAANLFAADQGWM